MFYSRRSKAVGETAGLEGPGTSAQLVDTQSKSGDRRKDGVRRTTPWSLGQLSGVLEANRHYGSKICFVDGRLVKTWYVGEKG